MRVHHALRLAGGPGRVVDAREIVGIDGRTGRSGFRGLVHEHDVPVGRQPAGELGCARLRHQDPRSRVGERLRQPLGIVSRVERDIGRPRLEDAEDRHDEGRIVLEQDGHRVVRPAARTGDDMRHRVRPGVQLGVGQLDGRVHTAVRCGRRAARLSNRPWTVVFSSSLVNEGTGDSPRVVT